MARLRNELLFLETDALKTKMMEVIEHFDQPQIKLLHCWSIFGKVIDTSVVQKAVIIVMLSCGLIAVETLIFYQVKK